MPIRAKHARQISQGIRLARIHATLGDVLQPAARQAALDCLSPLAQRAYRRQAIKILLSRIEIRLYRWERQNR